MRVGGTSGLHDQQKATGRARSRSRTVDVLVPLVLILAVVVVFGSLLFVSQRNSLTENALERIGAIATVQEARIESSLSENAEVDLPSLLSRHDLVDGIRKLGRAPEPNAVAAVTAELNNALIPAFADLLVLSEDGTVLASTDPSRLGDQFEDQGFVAAALRSVATAGFRHNSRGELIHTVGRSVQSGGGVAHILVLESAETGIDELSADYTGLGSTGETVVAQLDDEGDALFIVPLRFDSEAAFVRKVSRLDLDVPITQAMRGNEATFAQNIDYRGVAVLSASRFIPEANLGLVVKMDRSEALDAVDDLASGLIRVFLGFAAVLVVISIVVIRLLRNQDSLRRISKVFEEAFDPMIVEDRDNIILEANERALMAYGWERQELIGRSIDVLIPPEYSDIVVALRRRFWAGEMIVDIEIKRRTKSGDLIPDLLSMSALTDVTGRTIGAVTVAKDLTGPYQVQQELMAARDEAETANRAKSEFLSRMSHELRTPLNSVLGFAQILELNLELEEELESVGYIRAGGEHLLSMIDDILDLSRIDSGTLRSSADRVPLRSLTSECLGLVRPQMAARRIVVLKEPTSEAFVRADVDRVRQVMLNLLSNAIKFNSDGGSITIDVTASEESVRWAITDTGRGIAKTLVGNLFTPFERLGVDASDVEGTGLGLALSKRLIETMGGSMGVDTTEGRGSTFWFSLPGVVSAEAGEKQSDTDTASTRLAEVKGSVLYIDDDPNSVRLVERLVRRLPGVRLTTAMDGRSGVRAACDHQPDLILVGNNLTDLSTDELLSHLRSNALTNGCSIALASGPLTEKQIRRFFAVGVVDRLEKPIAAGEFIDLVIRHLAPVELLPDP